MTASDFSPQPEGRLNKLTPAGSRFKADLMTAVNAHGIDTEMGMPDFVIASLIMNLLESVRAANATSEEWKNS